MCVWKPTAGRRGAWAQTHLTRPLRELGSRRGAFCTGARRSGSGKPAFDRDPKPERLGSPGLRFPGWGDAES